jgi:hypothetical protein
MEKLWFFYNTMQLSNTFTDFNLVKEPANVSLVQRVYNQLINLSVTNFLPAGFFD